MLLPTGTATVVASAPSTQKLNPVVVQSMRYWCEVPIRPAPSDTSELPLLRAYTASPAVPLPTVTHGAPNAAPVARPTFWNGSPRNVATNSIELPGPKVALLVRPYPSIDTRPPPTASLPPPCHEAACHSGE